MTATLTKIKLAPQVFVSHTKPTPDSVNEVARDLFWKPRGGLWTSTLDDEGGDWVRWLKSQDYPLDDPRWGGKLWRLEPAEAHVCVIATPNDYNDLCDRFPYPDNPLLGKGVKSMEKIIDWQSVALNYDAVHIPTPWDYRFGLSYTDDYEKYYAAGMFFNVCDAESTCWFRWCFEGEPEEVTL